jgi:hypothetical protein
MHTATIQAQLLVQIGFISLKTAASNTHQAIQLQGFLKGQRAYGYKISLFKRANTGWHRVIIHD